MKFFTRLSSVLLIATSFLFPAMVSASATIIIGFGSGGSGAGSAGCTTSGICQVASTILFIINSVLVPLLFAIAFIVFLYGIAKAYIFSGGDAEAVKEGHKLVLWGVIAFAVMISLWGLVNVVANTFGLYGYSAPPPPTSYPQ